MILLLRSPAPARTDLEEKRTKSEWSRPFPKKEKKHDKRNEPKPTARHRANTQPYFS
jgi:hypothetical protein